MGIKDRVARLRGALLHLHHDCDDDDDDVGGDESDDNDDDADDLNVIWGGGGISDGELNGPQCNLHSVQLDHPDHDDDGGCNDDDEDIFTSSR